jgi:hypothetical protein
MSNAASNYLENKILDHVLRYSTAPYTGAGTLYAALFDGTAETVLANLEAGTLTDEITLGSYARKAVTFGAAASGTSANSNTVTFDTATANYDGVVTCVAIMDALTTGNVLFYGQLSVAKTVTTGDTFQIAIGNLQVTLS